jgi:uncharacterized protein (TIGR02284 family)
MEDKSVVRVLNQLIETTRDGEAGFRTCADGADDVALKSYFSSCASRCASALQDLSAQVASYGGEPEGGGTIAGAAHRAWVNVKTAITSKDDLAVLQECETGEDHALKVYQEAMQQPLPPDVARLVLEQYEGVRQNHDRIKALRDERKRRSA